MFWLKCSFWLCGLLALSVPALADTPRLDGTRLVLDGKPVAESKNQPVLSVTGKPLTIRVSIVHEHPVDADGEILEGKKGLYFFDADNKFIGFVYNEDAEGVRDVVQSPDKKVIAIRSATTDGGHGLELLSWPELKLMPGGTDYVACATFPSFAWANNTFYYTAGEMVNAVGRFDAPGKATTSRTGVPEEADMQSVIAVDMASGAEKLVVRGTPLCDMRVLQVEGDNLVLGKYCMAKEGDWAKKKKPVEERIVIPLAAIEAKAPDLKGENRALLRDIHVGRQQAKELCPTMPFLYCMTEDRQLLALCAREEDYGVTLRLTDADKKPVLELAAKETDPSVTFGRAAPEADNIEYMRFRSDNGEEQIVFRAMGGNPLSGLYTLHNGAVTATRLCLGRAADTNRANPAQGTELAKAGKNAVFAEEPPYSLRLDLPTAP